MRATITPAALLLAAACAGTEARPLDAATDAGAAADGGGDTPADNDAILPASDAPGEPALVDRQTGRRLCVEEARLGCELIERCAPFYVRLLYGGPEGCTATRAQGCDEWLTAHDWEVSEAQLSACVEATRAAQCEQLYANEIAACVLKGARASGEPCRDGSQCQTGRCVRPVGACGVCGAFVPGGGKCDYAVGGECAPGLVCGPGGVCVAFAEPGAGCNASIPCRFGHACRSGTCVAQHDRAGAPCVPPDEGEGDLCDNLKGLFCDPEIAVCRAAAYAPTGGACGLVGGEWVACLAGGVCSFGEIGATCAPAPAEGEPCSAELPCREPARCRGSAERVCRVDRPPATCP